VPIPRTTPEPPTLPVPRPTPVVPGRTGVVPPAPVSPVTPGTRAPGVVAPFPRPKVGTSTYSGGGYGEMVTEPITGMVTARPAEPVSGSLTGHLLARNQELYRRHERRQKLRTAMWVALGLTLFAASIAIIVNLLAGDFLRSLFSTFVGWAG
jgi:hypothetical protein